MINSTQISYLVLDCGPLKYLCFLIVALFYISIIFANTVPIVVICVNRSLHQPMYIFLCSLFVNELYGSTGLFPFLMAHILSDTYTVSRLLCFVQMFCMYTYSSLEFCNLAVLSYDRYIAICYPLHYNTRMTSIKVAVLIAVIWVSSFVRFLITMTLRLRFSLCGNVMNRLYCESYLISKLACSGTRLNSMYGQFNLLLTISVPLIPICFSYIKVLKICVQGSKETRQRAIHTCTPHLASLLNYSVVFCFLIMQSRFDMTNIPAVMNAVLSLYFLICQPLFNPIMYGLRMSEIQKTFRRMVFKTRLSGCPPDGHPNPLRPEADSSNAF